MWSKNTEKEREGARFFDTVLLIVFAAFICVTAAAILFFPQREFSEIENRRLQTVSDIDIISDAKSGRLTEKIGDMLSDQFPFRHALTKLKADIEPKIDALDSIRFAQHIVAKGDLLLTGDDLTAANINGVGNADATDVVELVKYIVSKEAGTFNLGVATFNVTENL